MGDDPTVFLIFMGLCASVGLLLSLSGPEPRVIERKVREDEMEPYLAKPKSPKPKCDLKGW